MMRIKVVDDPARKNVELFLEALRSSKPQGAVQQVFNAWMDSSTGRILFSNPSLEGQSSDNTNWKPLLFGYEYDAANGEILFFLNEAGSGKGAFQFEDLAPQALHSLTETMKVFAKISQNLKGPSDFSVKLSVLTKTTIASTFHEETNPRIAIWHHADRMEAETLLKDKPAGTYMLRKDPYADILEEELQNQLGKEVQCITLTYTQEEEKVSDLTLVHFEKAWQVYDDDPELEQMKFPDLQTLMASFKSFLRYPLYKS